MLIRLQAGDTRPVFEQIAAQLRRAIAKGSVQIGERLPTARELAEALGVNMHTVLRAYGELQEEGLLDIRRGRGVTVCPSAAGNAALLESVKDLAREARRLGLSRRDVMKLLEAEL